MQIIGDFENVNLEFGIVLKGKRHEEVYYFNYEDYSNSQFDDIASAFGENSAFLSNYFKIKIEYLTYSGRKDTGEFKINWHHYLTIEESIKEYIRNHYNEFTIKDLMFAEAFNEYPYLVEKNQEKDAQNEISTLNTRKKLKQYVFTLKKSFLKNPACHEKQK